MIRNYLYFEYAGIDSRDFDIANVNVASGMLDEPFVGNISLLEHKVRGKDKPYFKRKENNPLTFTVSFAFTEPFNQAKIRQVANWLTRHDYYQPLSFLSDEEGYEKKIYYALVVEDSSIIHNGLGEGYLNLTFRCDSSWAYLQTISTEEYILNGINNTITLSNSGDLETYPLIEIEKINNSGELIINNTTNNSKIHFYDAKAGSGLLKFNGTVYDGETVQIGDEIYEFDTGDGEVESGNILVDVSTTSDFARARLNFINPIKDKNSISIGEDTYEFSSDDNYRFQNIPIDISNNITLAEGILEFNGNPKPLDRVVIGNTRYVFDRSTAADILKIPRHGVDSAAGIYCIVNRSFPNSPMFVKSIDMNFLKLIEFQDNNPFNNPITLETNPTLEGQKEGDIIEIYNGTTRQGVELGTTASIILTNNTQGLRTGDLVGLQLSSGAMELKRIASVSQNSRITLFTTASETPVYFYGFPRVGLRPAEGAALETPYVVTIGGTIQQSVINLKKAINLDGIATVNYGSGMIQNELVEANIVDGNPYQIKITSRFSGSEGNNINTRVNDSFPGNFLFDTLQDGTDCPIEIAVTKLKDAVSSNQESPVLIGISAIGEDEGSDFIVFRSKKAGSKSNGLIGVANNDNVNWVNNNFQDGKDPSILTSINSLNNTIAGNSNLANSSIQSSDMLSIVHKNTGLNTNIFFNTNALNLFTSNSFLSNGRNELIIGEQLQIHPEKQEVISTVQSRYDTFNHKYLKLDIGDNILNIDGDCKIKFTITPKVY